MFASNDTAVFSPDERAEAWQDAYERAHALLFSDLSAALEAGDGYRTVATPDSAQQRKPAMDVVVEYVEDDAALDALIKILAQAAKSDNLSLRFSAQAWIAACCRKHADWHAEAWASGDAE
jgi:hypothetical protein